jgi:hypothetical protein
MLRRLLDSPWLYFGAAALLLVAALVTQFQVSIPSRSQAPPTELASLKERKDLNLVFILADTLRGPPSTYGYTRPTTPIIDDRRTRTPPERGPAIELTKTSMASMWTSTYPIRPILRYNHAA